MILMRDYAPEVAVSIMKLASEKKEPVHLTKERAKEMAKILGVSALGGGLGYATGHTVARGLRPHLHPETVGAISALSGAAVTGGTIYRGKKILDRLRNAKGSEERPARSR